MTEEAPIQCPKCHGHHGNDWSQCNGLCPMPMSPHYGVEVLKDHAEIELDREFGDILYNADPDCDHRIIQLWSGVRCSKCGGWFCF